MVRTIRIASIFSIGSVAALVMGCGAAMVPVSRSLSSTTNFSSSSSSTSTNTTTSTSGTTTVSPTSTGTQPPISLRVGTTGYNATTVQVQAGKVLKVKFTPGVQDQAISGTGVYAQYSHLGVYITVNGITGATAMLDDGLYSGQPQTSSALDFSNALNQACAGSASCRQTVTITIDHPNNDYWCLNYGQFCPWSHVYDTHPWHGTLTIQTDDTTAI